MDLKVILVISQAPVVFRCLRLNTCQDSVLSSNVLVCIQVMGYSSDKLYLPKTCSGIILT